jgi:hypothetical protein
MAKLNPLSVIAGEGTIVGIYRADGEIGGYYKHAVLLPWMHVGAMQQLG